MLNQYLQQKLNKQQTLNQKGRNWTYKGIIKSGDEYEFAVRGELGEGNSRGFIVFIINYSFEAGPFRVPNLAGPVVAGGDDERPVAVEAHGGHRKRVAPDDPEALSGLDLPNPDGLVERAGDDEVGLGVEVGAENDVGVAAEGLDALACWGACVPDAEGAVVGGGADVVGVGGPGKVGNALGVAHQAAQEG